MSIQQIYTAEEAAAILRTTPRHLCTLARNGEIRGMKISRTWAFPEDAIQEFIVAKSQPIVSGASQQRTGLSAGALRNLERRARR
ncbi:helix-turn-helix domain-containing protein [Mycetocola zhadangensis]|uniref:DNA-binding protein n=1 Tax=Mycetocola zhadangensis TaxID=1164595 RepID=A0A3L7J6A5_9MICO|nr:helix-turn-helix domain-containing protein [Mycetocola zhadangensis]RLQ86173.1 DNA-binding protein [Mycetocola zhadangensis]GGE88991.1 hypothetical protein GCM10011313_09610 [Mycetocola zhadangensis]